MTDTIDTVMGMIESRAGDLRVYSAIRGSRDPHLHAVYGSLCGMWSIYVTLVDRPDSELEALYVRALNDYRANINPVY